MSISRSCLEAIKPFGRYRSWTKQAVACLSAFCVTSCEPPVDETTESESPSDRPVASAQSAESDATVEAGTDGADGDADAAPAADQQPCPEDMVRVEGDYCLTVSHRCLESFAGKTATGSLGFDDQCFSYAPGSSRCGTLRKKVKVELKLNAGEKLDQKRADTRHAFGKKFVGVKAGDQVNGCTVERVQGYGRGVAREGSVLELDCPPVIHLSFCMDRYEFPNKKGATPARITNWYDAQEACEGEGKRLCEEHEWTLACEGPERQPYPNGWKREIWTADSEESRGACNISRCTSNCRPEDQDDKGRCTQYDPNLGKDAPRPACYVEPEWVQTQMPFQTEGTKAKYLKKADQASGDPKYPFLLPSGSMDRCVSPYGIYDMAGNVDEWVQSFDHHETKISNLKGGHYLHNCRARCRPVTTRHGPFYFQASVGFRCCRDPKSTAER